MLEKELHTLLNGLKERKQQRLAHLEALRRRDVMYCSRLGEASFQLTVPEGVLPSSGEIQALENRIETLTKEMVSSFMLFLIFGSR